MSYFAFIIKKISRKWMILIPVVLMSAFIIIIYTGERNSVAYTVEIDIDNQQKITLLKANIEESKEDLERFEPASDAYKNAKAFLKSFELELHMRQLRMDAYESKNWTVFYENDIGLKKQELKLYQSDKSYDASDVIEAVRLDIDYSEYMADHKLSFAGDRWRNTQGASFAVKVANDYLPVILAVLVIFISSMMYCFNYKDRMDIHKLIPLGSIKKQCTMLIAGVSCGVAIFLFFILLSLACGGIMESIGTLQIPVLTYTLKKADAFIPLIKVLPQALLLFLLSIFFLVNFVSVIASITRKNMVCLVVSLAFLGGMMWATTSIVPLFSYTHMLPTTYFSSFKIVTGQMMNTTNNVHVTVLNGVIVLCISNAVLFLSSYYISKWPFKKVSV